MKPIELVRRDTGELAALACGKCGEVQGLSRPEMARRLVEECCAPARCKGCGGEVEPGWATSCKACRDRYYARLEAEARAKAARVSLEDYLAEMGGSAMVCTSRYGDDGYIDASRAAEDGLTWAWACTRQTWGRPHVDSIVETVSQDLYEDAAELLDVKGLQEVVDKWLAEQPDPNSWMVDERRIVILREGEPC